MWKYINRCESPSSGFFLIYIALAQGMDCKCCILWRGIFAGIALAAPAVYLITLAGWLYGAGWVIFSLAAYIFIGFEERIEY